MHSPRIHKALTRLTAFLALAFFALTATAAYAQNTNTPNTATTSPGDYNLCWTQAECLDPTLGGTPKPPANHAICDNQHCYEPGAKPCPAGQGACYANPPAVPLVVHIGNFDSALDLGDYIAKVYNYGFFLAGILAAVMFIVGGFQYLTGGDSDRINAAKKRIIDALVGLLLVMSAYLVLNTINPDILSLKMPKIPLVKKKIFIGCTLFQMQVKCGDPFSLIHIDGTSSTAPIEQQYRLATPAEMASGAGQSIVCRGASCSKANSQDGTYRCQIDPAKKTTPPATAPTQCGGAPADPYICAPCGGWGQACTHLGQSDDCCTGFCGSDTGAMITDVAGVSVSAITGNGTCTNGENGVTCQSGAQCRTGRCQTRWFNHCSSGLTGAACDDSTQCASGYACAQVVGIYICTPKVPGSYCYSDTDCPSGYVCPNSCGLGAALRSAGALVVGGGAAVASGVGGPHDFSGCDIAARCRPSGLGPNNCTSNDQCATFGAGLKCTLNMKQKVCSTGVDGSPCKTGSPSDCNSGICVNAITSHATGGDNPGICSDGGVGERCGDDSQCKPAPGAKAGHCYLGDEISTLRSVANWAHSLGQDAYGFCVSGLPGSGCVKPTDCEPQYECSTNAHMCIVKPSSC